MRATLYASALGLVELELDGERVGTDLFTPGWTDYEKRVHYLDLRREPLPRARGRTRIGATL